MNKISKGKAVGLLSLGLASVALGSVGFASWVVSGTKLPDPTNVSVTVGEVSDQRITITAALNTGDPSVTLDAKSTQNLGPIKGSGDTAEDLTFKVDITGKKGAQYSGETYKCKFAVAFPSDINDGTYVTVASVKAGEADISTTYTSGFDLSVTTGGQLTTCTFTLKWGSAFGNKNPADLSESEANSLGVDNVIAALQKVKTAFTSGKITVTLSSAA